MIINLDMLELFRIKIILDDIRERIKKISESVYTSNASFYFDKKSKDEFLQLVEDFNQAINGG